MKRFVIFAFLGPVILFLLLLVAVAVSHLMGLETNSILALILFFALPFVVIVGLPSLLAAWLVSRLKLWRTMISRIFAAAVAWFIVGSLYPLVWASLAASR